MAKKAAPSNVADERPGAGWRQCKKCDKWTKGTRAPKCANCGADFPKPKTSTTTVKNPIADTLNKLSEAKEFIKESGGYDEAKAKIERFKNLTSSFGGFDQLTEAIDALQKWEGS